MNNLGFPPAVVSEEEALIYKDALEEIVPEKLKELLDYQDKLIKIRELKLKALDVFPDIDEATEYFWLLWMEIEFEQYYKANRWLKYWLRLSIKSGNNDTWAQKQDVSQSGFTQEQIDKVKEVPIQDIFEGKIRQMGSRFIANCPFHKEKTPSFVIFENDNNFYCFGCNVGGDVIDYYMKLNEVDFPTAIKALL